MYAENKMFLAETINTAYVVVRSPLLYDCEVKTLNILFEFVFLQVADVYIGLDVMSSQMDVRVPNFRKLNLKGFSVYGMAQPARDVSKQGE